MHRAHALYWRQATDEQSLLVQYGPLIEKLARRIASRVGNPNLGDDLWSAGALGLLDAAQRFDPALAIRFETFAQHRIRGAMVDELRRLDHLPRRLRAQASRVAKARDSLDKELGRPAEDHEVAEKLGMDVSELGATEAMAQPPAPLLPEALRSLLAASPEDQALQIETRQQLAEAVGKLPERLQILLSLHYVEDLTYREIAEVLRVSQPRVSQLHAEAVGKLREALGERATA
jgi:RNA polymerase sigma factor for flagellar operon FliA